MDEINQRASELAAKMDSDFFNRKLIDTTEDFISQLGEKKANLSKGDLLNLIKFIVRYPDISKIPVNTNVKELARLGGEAKDLVTAVAVQLLIEEGQKQSTPTFQPEGE